MVTLSVLDQSPIRSGGTPADAIAETLRLAEHADRLGYTRYWLAEHHASAGLAGSSPEILIGAVAARTQHLRVGSGGVMLSHYSSLKVAESFRVLETLYPGRIDLGIGRAPGSDQKTARALAPGPGALGIEQFRQQIADLLAYLEGELPAEHPFAGVRAMPTGPTTPEVWMLGSSDEGAKLAAHFGTAYSFAHFINANYSVPIVRMYQEHFRPSASLPEPRASLGVFAICADTEDEAARLAKSRALFIARLYTGQHGPYPSPEEAESHLWTAHELAIADHAQDRSIVGTPDRVRDRLLHLAQAHEVDELMVVTITHDFAARLRSYELLAEAFGLQAPAPQSADVLVESVR